MKNLLMLLSFAIVPFITSAQHINNAFTFKTDKKNAISASLELDPAVFWGISYTRGIDMKIGDFERRIATQIGWKTFKFNYNDLNLNLFTHLLNDRNKLNVLLNVGAENKYLENTVHQANIYNWISSIMPGYFSERWYVGTEVQYKWLFRAKYDHTEFYQELFPDINDGWYTYKNVYWNLSVNLGARITKHVDIDVRAGYRFNQEHENYQPYILPYFFNLSLNSRF